MAAHEMNPFETENSLMNEPGSRTDAALEFAIAAERQRCIDRVLTYAALRDRRASRPQ